VDCVSDNVVELPIVIFSFCVFGVLAFLVLFVGLEKPLSRVPDSETDAPLTAVTLPLAIVTFAPANDPRPFEPLPLIHWVDRSRHREIPPIRWVDRWYPKVFRRAIPSRCSSPEAGGTLPR
jgi:hypothetical protein